MKRTASPTLFWVAATFWMAATLLPWIIQAQARPPMSVYELERHILSQRPKAPKAGTAELRPMPDWPNRCFDVTEYAANLTREWSSLCLPVLEAKASGTLDSCLAGVQSPQQLARSLASCVTGATDAPAWLTEVAQCSVTSFITASSMSEQDRADWKTFIQGISDVRALIGFARLFDDQPFLDLAEMANTASFAELTRKAQALGLKEQKRYERLTKVPGHLDSIVAAALTVPALRREQIDLLSDTAARLVDECEPEPADEIYAQALDETARHVEHMQNNLAIAEHAFFCAASKQGFASWPPGRQQEFLGQLDLGGRLQTGDRILRRAWEKARNELASAHRLWTNLRDDPRLSLANLENSRQRRITKATELETLVTGVTGCLDRCGRDCGLPLQTLQEVVAAERVAACTRGGLRDEYQLDELWLKLGRAATATSAVLTLGPSTRAAMTNRLQRCDVSAARNELSELERTLQNFVRGDTFDHCAAPELAELRTRLDQCEAHCAEPGAARCEAVTVRVSDVERGTR